MIRIWDIENLDCASCTSEIERTLTLTPGVKEAQLNFMAKKLTIESEQDQPAPFWKNIEMVARSASPGLVMHSRTGKTSRSWRVEGLDCASCANKVERSIARMDGISSVSLDFMQKKLIAKSVEAKDEQFWNRVDRKSVV